jgi:hypothetical protein
MISNANNSIDDIFISFISPPQVNKLSLGQQHTKRCETVILLLSLIIEQVKSMDLTDNQIDKYFFIEN